MEEGEEQVKMLDATNRGFRLLQKMGWRQGTGLGKHEQGIVEPIRMKETLMTLGLGKAEEYEEMTGQATKDRKKLESEVVETEAEAQSRLVKAARDDQLKADVKAMQAAFYCQDCRKQYTTVKEMENHLSSYDHHHQKRLRELQQQKKQAFSTETQQLKRKREQQQEDLMLQKRIQQAAKVAADAAVRATETSGNTATATASVDTKKLGVPTAKVGFSFGGGGMKKSGMMMKRSGKKIGTVAAAFSIPFTSEVNDGQDMNNE